MKILGNSVNLTKGAPPAGAASSGTEGGTPSRGGVLGD